MILWLERANNIWPNVFSFRYWTCILKNSSVINNDTSVMNCLFNCLCLIKIDHFNGAFKQVFNNYTLMIKFCIFDYEFLKTNPLGL